jgi:hypothetical protein
VFHTTETIAKVDKTIVIYAYYSFITETKGGIIALRITGTYANAR